MKLTDYGRRQAFLLNQVYEPVEVLFQQKHSSDLQRCADTAFYAMGFPYGSNYITYSKLLREMHFGEKEGLHYDGLSQAEKDEINSPDFHPKGGESWEDVRNRMEKYFGTLTKGSHLIFSHGGPITVCLQEFGV